jgi:hypothetical protein
MARDVAYLRSACAIFVGGEENAIVIGIIEYHKPLPIPPI